MKGKIIAILAGLIIITAIFAGSSMAGGDNNCNTNGEDGNYEDNNNNPFDDDNFPGEDNQQRSGVVWP